MSTLKAFKSLYIEKNTQFIITNNQGLILDSDDVLFKANAKAVINDIHPFFTNIFDGLTQTIQFTCVHLNIKKKNIICDIKIKAIEDENFLIIISDFSSHYNSFQSLAQSRNETAIQAELTELDNLILNKKEEFKNQFLANFSHEIVSPILSIITFSDILKNTSLNHEQKEYIEIIRTASQSLESMTNDIFDISKIETGILDVEKKKFSLKKLFRAICLEYSLKFKERNIKFVGHYADDMPIYLVTDKLRLKQIIGNLLDNALKYTLEGQVDLIIRPIYKRARKISFYIEVKDTGIGIAKEDQADIFNSFVRLETHHKTPGVGLGLTIVKALLELLNGEITVDSKINKGTNFTATVRATTPLKENKRIEVKKDEDGTPKEILLVEDNTNDQLSIFKIIANSKNYYLDIANSGEEAIKLAKNKTYDLILMDFKLSALTGFETSKIIRENSKTQVSILIITGVKIDNDLSKHYAAYHNAILRKPFTQETLLEEIKLLIK